jgi:hypothetical protein
MLCIPMLVEILTVPVRVADTDEELSGLTSSQGLAFTRIGAHNPGRSSGPMNWHRTSALSTRSAGCLQNFTLPPVKRGLVQLSTPSSNLKKVLIAPVAGMMEKGCFTTLSSVEMELPLTLNSWPLLM